MTGRVRVGNMMVGPEEPVFIIAEIGINHNGIVENAKKLIHKAVSAGADAVKFQKRTVPVVYSAEELALPRAITDISVLESAIKRGVLSQEACERLVSSSFRDTTNGDLKWALEFTEAEYAEIDAYCRDENILWFASPWDEESVDFLEQFDPPCYKIASASMTDDGLLRHTRAKGRPVILSTGMSDLPMIEHAVEVLGTEDLIILHCTSVYPQGKVEEGDHGLSLLNLRGIETLRETFPSVPIGFSGNDTGIMPTYAAVAMGACVIEKHLTLYRAMFGSDQASSVEPRQFEDLCRMVRELRIARGDGIIRFYNEERPVAAKLRRK